MPMGPPQPRQVVAPDAWMRSLGTLPLVHQPGEQWLYNTGSDILSVLIARAAQQPFDEFLCDRIFEPLGMHDTGFVVPPEKRDRFATSYTTNIETGALELFDEPDGTRIVARASVELMTTDHLTAANKAFDTMVPGYWDDHGYGFGVSVTTARTQLQAIGSYGWDGGLGTSCTTILSNGSRRSC